MMVEELHAAGLEVVLNIAPTAPAKATIWADPLLSPGR